MNWIDQINAIRAKLSNAGYVDTVSEITNAQMVLGTAGEMFLSVMDVLMKIKESNTNEYLIAKKEIEALIEYGKSINYL